MRKTLIIIFIIIAAVVQANAQNANNPKIAFEAITHDSGTIAQNSDGTHVFRFSNDGKSPLLVTSAFSSCGCVIPEWPKEPIMPKQKASVKVRYNRSKPGALHESNSREIKRSTIAQNGFAN